MCSCKSSLYYGYNLTPLKRFAEKSDTNDVKCTPSCGQKSATIDKEKKTDNYADFAAMFIEQL